VTKTALNVFLEIKQFDQEKKGKFDELRNKLSITRVPAPENGG
jgi:hypothetical protein